MEFDLNVNHEYGLRLILSFIAGTLIGFEREYNSKAAGLRTMIMICMGSTIFTEVSLSIGGYSEDRIASNIVTGVGFLGAGVIFKDALTVTGLTTASTIWISAALGMTIGVGEYYIALVGLGIVLSVLSLLSKAEVMLERVHQVRSYKIKVMEIEAFKEDFKKQVKTHGLKLRRLRDLKDPESFFVIYDVSGRQSKLELINKFLMEDKRVVRFEY